MLTLFFYLTCKIFHTVHYSLVFVESGLMTTGNSLLSFLLLDLKESELKKMLPYSVGNVRFVEVHLVSYITLSEVISMRPKGIQ